LFWISTGICWVEWELICTIKDLRYNINKIYIPLIWIVQNGCQSRTAMVRPLNKNDVNSSWKSQTKSMKWDFNNAHIVIESQNFYFYIKSIWYKMLNLNFSKIEMLKELEHWL
jgi:hypothetical protein